MVCWVTQEDTEDHGHYGFSLIRMLYPFVHVSFYGHHKIKIQASRILNVRYVFDVVLTKR